MPDKKPYNLELIARISLIVLLVSIVGHFVSIYQVWHQLITPLIPQSTILEIIRPSIFIAFVSSLICLLALIFYFYRKNVIVIVLVGLTIGWQQFYTFL